MIISNNKQHEKADSNHIYYNIRFLESGYEDCVRGDSIKNGWVKDNLSKTLCGIASIGYINSREHFREHHIWSNIIHRCYDPNDKSYKYYGAKGVKVCERWLRFDYFFEDMKKIKGYDEELFQQHKIRLDKDILSKDQKIYSLKTTMWVSDLINQKQRTKEYNTKHSKFAVFPDGHIEQIYNISDFCKQHNLHRANVTNCLAGKQKTSKGFRFYKGINESTDYPISENDTQQE